MNLLREKLVRGEHIFGTLVCLSDPCLCEIMGRAGYDCIWIDTEHSYMSHRDVLAHLNAARATGMSTLVRLPQNDLTDTKKILEMGPDAILFPMVRSAKDFEELISMTLYPPLGTRGFGPMRAIDYGARDAKEYVTTGQMEMCRLMQIEHVGMIDELEKIAANPYVDGFIFGPNDLSGSLGEFLDVFEPATQKQIHRAIDILRRHNKWIGLAGGADERALRVWSALDLDMLFCGGDWNFLYAEGKNTLQRMKQAHEQYRK